MRNLVTATLAAVACAIAIPALIPSAGAKPIPTRLRLPGRGQSTVSVAQFTYRGSAPRGIRPKLRNRARIGPAYRGLYATYRRRHGRLTTFTFLTLILRKEGRVATRPSASLLRPAARPPRREGQFDELGIFFLLAGLRPDGFTEGEIFGEFETGEDNLEANGVTELLGEGAPTRPAKTIVDLLEGGGLEFGKADGDGRGVEPFETGHYDDGHSFGWKPAGTEKALDDWLKLSDGDAAYQDLRDTLERDLGVDLNGDGKVGGTRAEEEGHTTVGEPVVLAG